MQQDVGAFSMDSMAGQPMNSFTVSMDTIHVITQRAVKLNTYGFQSSQWVGLTINETLALMQERYPDMTDEDEFYVNFFYPLWQQGNTSIIAVDGEDIAGEEANDQAILEQLDSETTDTMGEFLEAIDDIGEVYQAIVKGEGAIGKLWELIRSSENAQSIGIVVGFFAAVAMLLTAVLAYALGGADLVIEIAQWFLSSLATVMTVYYAIEILRDLKKLGDLFKAIEYGKWGDTFLWAGFLLQAGAILYLFLAYAAGHSGITVSYAAAAAIVQLIMATLFFVLSLFNITFLFVALYTVIDFISNLFGYDITGAFTTWLTNTLYNVKYLVKIPPDVEIAAQQSAMATPNAGPVPGNQFILTAEYAGKIEADNGGSYDDLRKTSLSGEWSGSAEPGEATASALSNPNSCLMTNADNTCTQDLQVRYLLQEAKRNMALELLTINHFVFVIQGCPLIGKCSTEVDTSDYPEANDADGIEKSTVTLYLDVLPATLDELWNWDQLNNPDIDGDGLPNTSDPDPNNWDHDGDTLSDAYEVQYQSTRGTLWNAWDSDGDGLGDWDETGIASNAGDPDTDNDGLLDGEEWLHEDQNGVWSGGWQVRLFETTTAFTISDPTTADSDTDGLLDSQERAGQSSPWATNVAPALLTVASPHVVGPGGRSGVFVKPGDPVSWLMTVFNDSNRIISSTITTCLPAALTNLTGGQLTGDVAAPLQIGACTGGAQYAWNFAPPTQLGLGLEVTATLTADVDAALTSSVAATISTTLPYSDTTLVRGDTITVDAEPPLATFSSPVNGAVLKGDSLVVGGTASDPTSWVTAVQVDLADGQGWQTPSGLGPWQATWMLPSDGVYTLQARATDYVGHQSNASQVSVTVDNTAPAASLALNNGDFIADIDPYETGGARVTLSGSASDNLSGLDRIQVSIDRKPWQQATLTTTGYPTQSDWTYLWRLPSDAGQGEHVISVRAWDRAGNVSESSNTTVVLDLLPPGDMLSNLPDVLGNVTSFALEGHSDDIMNVPLPARPETLAGSGLDAYDSATIWLEPPSPLVDDAMTVAWLGDVNGDSRADLAVGLPAANDGAGKVVIIYGAGGGWPVIPDATALSDSPSGYVGAADAGIGSVIAPAGDVNGDGLSDMLIGDPANERVFLVFGQATPNGSALSLDDEYVSNWLILTTSDNLVLGSYAAAAGDVDGDGFDDVLIGGLNASGAGKAYLLAGQATSWNATTDLATMALASYPLPGSGAPATGVGDVNSDGYDDFAISDPANSLGNGRVVSLYFGAMTPPTAAGATVTANSSAAVGAQITALGDVNGDTLPDFGFSNGPQPRVVYGRSNGWTTGMTPDVTFGGSTAFDGFIAAPGDVNLDGLNDILLGSSAGGGTAYLFHGSSSLASNQPVQAQIANVAAAASAPYAAGADLNCDLSSDLLLVPVAVSNDAELAAAIGPAPAPRPLASLPGFGRVSQRQLAGRAQAEVAAAGTPAIAFRAVSNTVSDWATASAFTGDFDGDGKADVAGWDASLSAWRLWHSDGYNMALTFSEYTHNLPAALGSNTARLLGDFDGDGLDDIGYWDGASWQLLRAAGASGSSFSFTAVTSNLGAVTGGNTSQILATDFDGDGRTDLLAWNGSLWESYISQAAGSAFDFNTVSNPLGGLAGGNAAALIAGDFDGDGLSDLAARNQANTGWIVLRSSGLAGGALGFDQLASSLSPDVTSAAADRSADFNGDGKTDVLAVVDGEAEAWLGKGLNTSMPFQAVANNVLQFSGQLLADGLTGDFDGDGKDDYASPDAAGTGWVFQLGGESAVRVVDDDYCATCANDGLTWGVDAFADLQPALDAAWFADTIYVQPGTYSGAVVHAGRDMVTIQGTDADAVFIDGGGSTGLLVFPPSDQTVIYPDIRGVTLRNLTISNVSTGVQINYGGDPASATLSDGDNIRLRNLLVYLDRTNSAAVQVLQSAVSLRHLTLVSNAPGAHLIVSQPGLLSSNAIYLQDNLFVALPNTAPLPAWWSDANGNAGPTLNSHSGFASINGQAGDWSVAPAGNPATLMTRDEAAFLDWSQQVFRLGADSAAHGLASDGGDLGYYTYRAPVTVNPSFCADCDNDGLTLGVDAFTTIGDGIASGAQQVLIDPGVYRERVALVNGVSLFGSGAGLTVLAPPGPSTSSGHASGSGQALVSAENTRLAGLALMTVAGEGSSAGLAVDGQGSLTVERAIIRNTTTAISVTGSSALATLVNDTLVNNGDGVAAADCGSIDMRNSILAFNQETALSMETCATTALHTYNLYWRNGHDFAIDGSFVDQPGPGEIFADPRFTDADNKDFRPLADSPVVDAGDPSDPAPPGSGGRIDLGYAQAAEASVYASKDYCEQCLNDGLAWQVTAFDTIQDAVDNVPGIAGLWTVGVAGGSEAQPAVYHEHVLLPSGVRLVGESADTTVIDADDSGSPLTLDNVANVEVRGFTITNGGEDPGDAGIAVTGSSNQITITRNILGGISPDDPSLAGNGNAGVLFAGGATGSILFNTIVANYGSGVVVADPASWLDVRYNIVAFNDAGLDNSSGGQIFSDYNLLYNTDPGWCTTCQNYTGSVSQGAHDIASQNPAFAGSDPGDGNYRLTTVSPALDAVPSALAGDVPPGGGDNADMGYSELLALPVTLLLGKEGNSCALGNSGMAAVAVGVSYVTDPSLPVNETPPATWITPTLATPGDTGSYWSADVPFGQGSGLYRVYTRPVDQAGNRSDDARDWFRQSVTVVNEPPEVTLIQPSRHLTITAAAVQLLAAVTSTLDSPQVVFLVDSAPVSATLTLNGLYGAAVPLVNGLHTVRAQASDSVGNTTVTDQTGVLVITTADQATLTEPAPGGAIASASVNLAGYVHFQGTSGSGQVEVLVDGISQGMATVADPAALLTTWNKTVTLSGEGDHTLTLRASRTSGSSTGSDVNATLVLDTIAPELSIDPVSGVINHNTTFTGEASDPSTGSGQGSGLAGVDISLNGGHSWQPAELASDGSWSYTWQPPAEQDYAAFPMWARATDLAGNVTVASLAPAVDNLPPGGLSPITFSPDEGSYVDGTATLQITWSTVTDGSGEASVLVGVDQISTTVPSQVASGNSYSASLSNAGTWYAHVMTKDSAGNTWLRHFGPWTVSGSTGESLPLQSIIVDGLVDVQHGEWITTTERLDDDTRPAGQTQELYVVWDDSYFYTAWQGALWALDGTLVMYLDVQSGGTTDILNVGGNDLGIAPLPMSADYAVTVSGPNDGQLWRYIDGSGWQSYSSGGMVFAHGSSGGTEIRLPRALVGSGPVMMAAMAIQNQGGMWSAFPTSNSLTAAATSSYTWNDLATALPPNAGQPAAHHVTLGIGTLLGSPSLAGPDVELGYLIQVSNQDNMPLAGATMTLQAGEGMGFQEVFGAVCQSCPPGGAQWVVELAAIAAGQSETVEVRAQLGPDLSGLYETTTTATINLTDGSSQSAAYTTAIDSEPPSVTIGGGDTIRSGVQTIRGSARDAGIGVDQVRWRLAGQTDWQAAVGTRAWSFQVDVPPSGTLTVEVQAIDTFGHQSAIQSVELLIDNVPPVVEMTPPLVLGGATALIDGIAHDPEPFGGEIQSVVLQVNEDGPTLTVSGPFPVNPVGNRMWHILQNLPAVEGEEFQVRAWAIDAAGNVGEPTDWQTVIVDSLPPRTIIAAPENGDLVGPGLTLVWGIAQDGWGIDEVQVSVNGGVWQTAAIGDDARALVNAAGRQPGVPENAVLWALMVSLPVQPGPVVIQARSTDWAGNVESPAQKVRAGSAASRIWLPMTPMNTN